MYFNWRLFQITRGMRPGILFAAAVGLIAVGAGIARLALSGVVIAGVFQGEPFSSLTAPVIALAGLIGLRGLFQYWRDSVSYRTATKTKIELRKRLYEHALALGPGHFDRQRTGDVLMFLVDGVENLETFFGQYLPQLLVAVVAPIIIFAFVAFLDIQIGLIFLGFAAFLLVVPSLLQKGNRKKSLARRDSYGAMGADFLDSVQGLATLKAFGQSRRRGELLAARARHLYRSTMGVLAADGAAGAATTLGMSAGATLAVIWGGIRVSDGDLELQTLLIVLMLGAEVFRPLRELLALYHQGMASMSAAEGVFALLDSPVTIREPERSAPPPVPAGSSGGARSETSEPPTEMRFEGVSFGYEGGRRPALQDVSFTLHAGETLGLVGPSGAGKSTVVWLMLRFYDPQQGRVALGGHDLGELPLESIRSQVSVVTQDTYLFHGTVADNLRLGRPGTTREELEDAARAANAHDFITALPNGYETPIGERGALLSGGERQRIAIARALLKAAPILVLDEALSSVDARNEASIREALERLMEGRTTLIIAHRLSSVVRADRILVLDGGRLVESGDHAELATANGVYAQLMANQQETSGQEFIGDARALRPEHAPVGGDRQVVAPDRDPDSRGSPPLAAEPPGSLAVWIRLFGLVRRWRGKLALSLALGLTYHGSTIGLAAVSALLVAAIFEGSGTGAMLAVLGVVVPITAFSRWSESWASHDLAFRLLAEMRVDLYDKLEPLAPAYLVRRKSGDLASIVGGDIETIEFFFAHVITPAFVAVLVPGAVLLVLAFVAWPLALVLAPFLLLAAASPFFAQQRSERLGTEMRGQLGDLNAHMVDGIQGMREIVAFGAGRARVEETVRMGWAFAGHRLSFLKAQAFHASFIEALAAIGGLAVLTTGAWLVTQDQMARTQLPLATLLALSSFFPVAELASTLKKLMETLAASRRVFEIHDEPVPVQDGPGVSVAHTGGPKRPSISFEDVSFSYSSDSPPALQRISLRVEAGETIALVGQSGAGKTTCAHLLLRFWDPDSGSIGIQGHDLREYRLEALRSRIALVSQDTYLFNASIRDNLRMARQDARTDEIENAAQLANAQEFIESMPDGYDTLVGERGMQLSGGQRQRIAIARALLKDTPILLLDEATSHLDAVNEQQVREALRRLMEGRTTLVIAHRLSTVRDADHIAVLDSGRLVDEGTHRELLAGGGLYAQLVQAQLVAASSGQ